MKTEELSRTSIECGKLQERSLGLAKELAAVKLATDLNLGDEEMVKLASLGHSGNPQNTIDVLKKSLSLRNKTYKELMAQCNLLGRSDARARKKLEKSKEKIAKLNTRLQELEKALEQKENEVLRNLKSSYKGGGGKPVEEMAKLVNHSDHLKRSTNCPAAKNSSTFLVPNERDSVIDLEADSCFMDEDGFGLSPKMNKHPTPDSDFQESPIYSKGAILKNPEHLSANQEIGVADKPLSSYINRKNEDKGISEQLKAKKVTHVASATWMTETIIIDDISKQTPTTALKKEAQTHNSAVNSGGLFGSESANRTGKWCRSSSFGTGASNVELISVGSDGRGGRIKVLRDHDQSLDVKAKTLRPKKQKHGTQRSGQFHIEHFFKSGS
ncbi:uncharacterized protein LOC109819655 isoform X1 [Asparagus officinalis]|uniref:uncharacterized protein LOC109819655 isoform X1 n=2 Tax=Asparagus officinalis TaxID=4686 RepID=UPI00098E4E40|nr:uncharacterized protein LOC109819655 isoform X1 [Asparagus officinalis]